MMTNAPGNRYSKITITVLLLLFSAPFLLSWGLLHYTKVKQEGGGASHGELILPPRLLENAGLFDPATGIKDQKLYGKWSLMYLHKGGDCSRECAQNLYRMRQLWLATGKFAHRVQRVMIIFGPNTAVLSARQLKQYRGQLLLLGDIQDNLLDTFKLSDDDQPLNAGRLYLVDPLGNLMMSYPPATDPRGIIKDLKRLLRYSRIG
ncbi:MAG: SCO family protein [Gammaproteobacteria bacterium]